MQPKLVVITGPTASGKTALGVALAQRLGGEVVSADSMQIYRGMDIGTAKPTPEEMQGVPHHMIDIADPTENYSVSRYAAEATACVDDILARGKLPRCHRPHRRSFRAYRHPGQQCRHHGQHVSCW